MRNIKLILLGMVLASVAVASDEVRDGNWWRHQPRTMKVAYVLGTIDRAGMAECDVNINTAGTVGQLADGLDAFYGDFKNRAIPVQRASRIVSMSINGEAADKIQTATELARWMAANGL